MWGKLCTKGFGILTTLLWWLDIISAKKDSMKIVIGGDTDYSRFIKYLHDSRNCTYKDTLARIKPYVDDADCFIINFESSLQESGQKKLKGLGVKVIRLVSDESSLSALRYVGVNGVTIANNHIGDYRAPGVNRTLKILKKHGLRYMGVTHGKDPFTKQEPIILEKNGVKVGMLAYCVMDECVRGRKLDESGPALLNLTTAISQVRDLRKAGCHAIIFYMHWGVEFTVIPHADQFNVIQQLLLKVKIDLIVGSHPHVTQNHWYTNNTLVVPSLGNLLFPSYMFANFNFNDQYRNSSTDSFYENIATRQKQLMHDPTSFGRLISVEFNKNGIVKNETSYLPIQIISTKQHCLVTDKVKNTKWRMICGKGDPECIGTVRCNYLECDHREPLPRKMKLGVHD